MSKADDEWDNNKDVISKELPSAAAKTEANSGISGSKILADSLSDNCRAHQDL